MIGAETRRALLIEMHRAIAEAVASVRLAIEQGEADPAYPPGVELSGAERAALREIAPSADAAAALSKLVADAAARPLFNLFALIDGVADPDFRTIEPWLGLSLTEREDGDTAMWHDEFFETYWGYQDAYRSDA